MVILTTTRKRTMDKQSLKIQALLERVSELTTTYESKLADLRVELTVVHSQLAEAEHSLVELKEKDVQEEDQA